MLLAILFFASFFFHCVGQMFQVKSNCCYFLFPKILHTFDLSLDDIYDDELRDIVLRKDEMKDEISSAFREINGL